MAKLIAIVFAFSAFFWLFRAAEHFVYGMQHLIVPGVRSKISALDDFSKGFLNVTFMWLFLLISHGSMFGLDRIAGWFGGLMVLFFVLSFLFARRAETLDDERIVGS